MIAQNSNTSYYNKINNHKQNEQSTKWEEIFANNATDKGLIFKIYRTAHTTQQQKNTQSN